MPHVPGTQLGEPIHHGGGVLLPTVPQKHVQQSGLAPVPDGLLGDVSGDELSVAKGHPPVVATEVLHIPGRIVVLLLHLEIID